MLERVAGADWSKGCDVKSDCVVTAHAESEE